MIGSPSSASSMRTIALSGTRMPIVRRFGFCSRFGTSRVASSRNVYGPGVSARSVRYWLLSTRA